ncbi:hypothetical protein RGZ1_113 [Morganella phage vB_MmoM_Rgz1]|nr:hypothetical protein RGZ1_113 [Morganella phage vB_MmoM_Rgz1]
MFKRVLAFFSMMAKESKFIGAYRFRKNMG